MHLPLTPIEEAWGAAKESPVPTSNKYKNPEYQQTYINSNTQLKTVEKVPDPYSCKDLHVSEYSNIPGSVNITLRDKNVIEKVYEMDPVSLVQLTTKLLSNHFTKGIETFLQREDVDGSSGCINLLLVILLIWLFLDRIYLLMK